MEVVLFCHEVQQQLSHLIPISEAVCDVQGVRDEVLIILKLQPLQVNLDVSSRHVVRDGLGAELFPVGLPQGVPAAASWNQYDREQGNNGGYIFIFITI